MLRVTMIVSAGYSRSACLPPGQSRPRPPSSRRARMPQGRGQSGDGPRALHLAAGRGGRAAAARGGAALQAAGRRKRAVELQPELHARSGGDVIRFQPAVGRHILPSMLGLARDFDARDPFDQTVFVLDALALRCVRRHSRSAAQPNEKLRALFKSRSPWEHEEATAAVIERINS